MVRADQPFDATNLEALLSRWADEGRPHRVLLLLDGEVRGLCDEVRIRTAPGRLVQVRAGAREGARALGLAYLAVGGRVETAVDPRPGGAGAWTPLSEVAAEARVWADSIRDLLRPLGGLSAVLRAAADRLAALQEVPELARKVAALADGRRTVARILADAGVDELLAVRVLQRLQLEGAVEVLAPDDERDPLLPAPRPEGSQFSMPRQGWGDTSALPETDREEFEGQAVATDVRHWLHDQTAPPTLLSEEAFLGAYSQPEAPAASREPAPEAPTGPPGPALEPALEDPTPVASAPEPSAASAPTPQEDPPPPEPALHAVPTPPPSAPPAGVVAPEAASKVRQGVPYSTRRPEPAADEDDDMLKEAGVGGSGPWLVLGALAIVVVAIFALLSGGDDLPPAKDAGVMVPPVPTATVATSSVSTATVSTATVSEAPAPDGLRPTVAAPDAPEAVRDAEALVASERYADAERALARLRRTRPDDPAVMILSGMVYVDTNRLRRANRMADRALALDRRSFRAWVLKGSVLQFQRKDKRALDAYQRALKLGPDHPMSDQLRAVVGALERRIR